MTDMKKALVCILILTLLAGFCACANQNPNETAQTPLTTAPSVPVMKEPPSLTVSIGRGETFPAETCTYDWSYLTEDGTWSGTCADSLHPLDMQKLLLPVDTTVEQVELLFQVPPQNITVRCWNDTLFGNPNAPSTPIPLSGNFLELRSGGYVYEVIAHWDDGNAPYHGTVHYVFYIIKHSVAFAQMTPAAAENVWCGNTVTKIRIGEAEYAFSGSDSVNLSNLLISLSYDPALVCKCQPDFQVETEWGKSYGISLSGYVRCAEGQARLTEEQQRALLDFFKTL